jgi:MinD superfamily P-loop ATPase
VDAGTPIRFLSATLDVGEARPTPLIRGLLDEIEDEGVVLVDAPPGTSCSVQEVVKEADRVVLVTEPTPFGLHDLRLSVELAWAYGKQISAVINRADLGDEGVRCFLEAKGVALLGAVGFSAEIAAAYAEGRIAVAENRELERLLQPLYRSLLQKEEAA